jgi:hypothetical protein
MSMYVPNVGEKEALKDFLLSQAIVLGLYKAPLVGDGSLTIDSLEELPTGGGRGYAQKALTNNLVEGAAAADKWAIAVNAAGKAEGQYHNAALEWVFNTVDVADANTAYGIFGYTWILPFDAGSKEIKVGDTIKGGTSAATGIVTAVEINSGTWAAGTAAGYLKIKTKTGTFINDENIYVAGEIATLVAAPTAAGDTYSVGDTFKITTGGEGGVGFVLTLTGGDNSPVATIGVNPGSGGRNYTVGAGKATVKLNGGGNDALTVEIATLATAAYAVANTGITGDAHRKLLYIEPFSTGKLVEINGQKITYVPKTTLSSAA